MSAPVKVTLTTSDAESFEVERDVANRSVLIKNMLEGTFTLSYALLPPPILLPALSCPYSARLRPL